MIELTTMSISIIYEDDSILAINKPAGLAVHKVSPTDPQETLADILLKNYPYLEGVGDLPAGRQGINLRPGIVHRLDKETSGLMLIAKNQKSFDHLKNLFQTHQIKKEYLALVHGQPKEDRGTIDAPLGKLGTKQTTQIKGKKELVVRDAVTDYEVVQHYKDYTLIRVMPRTGRTHQIRVHLKHIGCPLAGDKLYASKKYLPEGLHRLFLHAWKLKLPGQNGQGLALEADLPSELSLVLQNLEQDRKG